MKNTIDENANPLYRLGVGMILLNKDDHIFMGQRRDQNMPAWQMPQGGIGPNESTDQAMLRELEEEIGTKNVEIIVKSKIWYKYDLPPELSNRLWGGKFKGQQQIWYALRFRGEDNEININTYHPEFRTWRWIPKSEVLDLIIPFKRDLYTRVFEDLWPYVAEKSA